MFEVVMTGAGPEVRHTDPNGHPLSHIGRAFVTHVWLGTMLETAGDFAAACAGMSVGDVLEEGYRLRQILLEEANRLGDTAFTEAGYKILFPLFQAALGRRMRPSGVGKTIQSAGNVWLARAAAAAPLAAEPLALEHPIWVAMEAERDPGRRTALAVAAEPFATSASTLLALETRIWLVNNQKAPSCTPPVAASEWCTTGACMLLRSRANALAARAKVLSLKQGDLRPELYAAARAAALTEGEGMPGVLRPYEWEGDEMSMRLAMDLVRQPVADATKRGGIVAGLYQGVPRRDWLPQPEDFGYTPMEGWEWRASRALDPSKGDRPPVLAAA